MQFGGVVGASGTSMATPHVVGVASVLMELNPDMPIEFIRALLNYSANLYGTTEEYGNGVVGDQMTILTYACGYPDSGNSGLSGAGEPYHGHLWEYQNVNGVYSPIGNSNYIANYIHLTKIARAYGNASSVPKGAVLSNDYAEMLEDFSTTTLGNRTWQQVFSLMNEERNSDIAVTSDNIKLFIYGIALHSMTDIFAHSAWANQNGWRRVKHTDDWNTNADNPNSFNCADLKENVSSYAFEGQTYYVP